MNLQEEIARVAYELYLKRGCVHGHDLDDWLEAERIVLSRYAGQEIEEPEGLIEEEETGAETMPLIETEETEVEEAEVFPLKEPEKKRAKRKTTKKAEGKIKKTRKTSAKRPRKKE